MRRAPAAVVAVLCGAVGCSTVQTRPAPVSPTPAPVTFATPVVVPTVPLGTPTPGTGAAIPTRPIKNPDSDAQKAAGKTVGPIVTYAGAARADGGIMPPTGKNAQGIPIYRHPVGSGFMIVIEGKPGISNVEVGRSIYRYDANDPSLRPDLEIEVDHPLGNGSAAVCDQRKPEIGGVPALDPPSFADTAQVAATLNDLSCRFETFIESNSSCTLNKYGDFEFANKDTKVQFCLVVARAWQFPEGDTLVSVRLRDTDGNPGPISRFILQKKPNPTQPPRARPTATPTVSRRRE